MSEEDPVTPEDVEEYAADSHLGLEVVEEPEYPISDSPGDSDAPVRDVSSRVTHDMVRASRRAALDSLRAGGTIQDASLAAGVSPQRIRHWLNSGYFKGKLAEHEAEALAAYTRQLASEATGAVRVLVKEQSGEDANVRIKAASRILSSADRILDRAKEAQAPSIGPLIVFPPGSRIAITMGDNPQIVEGEARALPDIKLVE